MLLRKQATLDHFEGKQVVLTLENGQQLKLLREELAGGKAELHKDSLHEGDVFVIEILPQAESELSKSQLASEIINQVLGSRDHDKIEPEKNSH